MLRVTFLSMKTTKLIAVLSLALAPLSQAAEPLKVGDSAPAFSLPSSQGKTVSLADFSGKQTLVVAFFPKAFTGGCTKEMTSYGEQFKSFTAEGAHVVGVSMDTLDEQTKFAQSLKLPFDLLSDEKGVAAEAYGVKSDKGPYANRVTFVVDKGGKITEVISGANAIDPAGSLQACKRKTS
jgi:peroxiredoxin Q/BCP